MHNKLIKNSNDSAILNGAVNSILNNISRDYTQDFNVSDVIFHKRQFRIIIDN